MPYTKIVNTIYEKLLSWSVAHGIRPSLVINYLVEEHAYVLDPSGVHLAYQWENMPASKLVRVPISRMASAILKDLAVACQGLPTHAIATLLIDEHMDGLTHSPEAYPGLSSLPGTGPVGPSRPRPTVGVYRPIYVEAKAQAKLMNSSIRAYCLGVLGAYDEQTYLEASNTTDFMAFRRHYAGYSFVPIMVPMDLHRTLTLLKEMHMVAKGPLVSYMLWRELESRALLERQGVKLQTGRQMRSLWGAGVKHLTTMHERTLEVLEGEEEE